MKKYMITFAFKNGARGKITLEAPNDKIAFLTASQLFVSFNEYDWDINKIM